MGRLKVIISAYACEPGKGSEPGAGWNLARHIAQHHDVWVLTRASNRQAIEAELQQRPVPGLTFVYYDLPRALRFWKRGPRGVRLYYWLWQIGAYFIARALHRRLKFDLAHHVTFGTYWMPAGLAMLPVPLVWGPLGGGEEAPPAFRQRFAWWGRTYETLRDVARRLAERDPIVRLAARRCDVALAATPETGQRLEAMGVERIAYMPQVGLGEADLARLSQALTNATPEIRFLSCGRLLHWKGFDLSLRAFAGADIPGARYWIIGDGPERGRLQGLAKELGIAPRVRFLGALPREDALREMSACDVLLHPSLHESGGLVCLEAMAMAKPVVCLELGGPAIQVSEECGFLIPAQEPGTAIERMSNVMCELAADADLRRRLGDAGRRIAHGRFAWSAKARTISNIYRDALRRSEARVRKSSRELLAPSSMVPGGDAT